MSFDPEISEWGNPPFGVSHDEYIVMRGEPGELKHLSSSRKRHQPRLRKYRRAKSEEPVSDSTTVNGMTWKGQP